MSRITLGSNIASLMAQRQLGKSSDALAKSSERLSSGMRINRASDDAAGLAIASSLNASSRIFSQGIRNINDGISMLSIVEGAGRELTGILTRIKELAEQSSNGTYGNAQRTSINNEAQSLRDEFNRILQTTSFNGIKLLDGSNNQVQIQAGGNAVAGKELYVGSDTIAYAGDGSFRSRISISTGLDPRAFMAADFNGDGKIDLVGASSGDGAINLHLGNGDGTFLLGVSTTTGANPSDIEIGDFNRDGFQDVATVGWGDQRISVLLGNGNGTFKARTSYIVFNNPQSFITGDVNGDGITDFVATGDVNDRLSVLIGNGDGTFKAQVSLVSGDGPRGVTLGDFNGDRILDIASISGNDQGIDIFIGNGNGTFLARTSILASVGPGITTADLNHDSKMDLIATAAGTGLVKVFLGNGDGSFNDSINLNTGGTPRPVVTGDFNSDGHIDISVATNTLAVVTLFGNGNGTFKAGVSQGAGNVFENSLLTADLNNDNVLDLVVAHQNAASTATYILLGNGTAKLEGFSLLTQQESRITLDQMTEAIEAVNGSIGKLGAQQSRLTIAASNLLQARENYKAAEGRIVNVDVAEESAELIRTKILQDAGASILAQANQLPALALSLLR